MSMTNIICGRIVQGFKIFIFAIIHRQFSALAPTNKKKNTHNLIRKKSYYAFHFCGPLLESPGNFLGPLRDF